MQPNSLNTTFTNEQAQMSTNPWYKKEVDMPFADDVKNLSNLGAMAGRNLIGTTVGGVGGYAYGGDMDSAINGAIAGTLGQHGGYGAENIFITVCL